MRKLGVICAMLLFATLAVAQEKPQEKKDQRPSDPISEWDWATAPYRLTFVLKESDDGKLINTRSYSMVLDSGAQRGQGYPQPSSGEIKAGSRVPLNGEKGITYMDVGVNLWARLAVKQSGGLILSNNTEISSLAEAAMTRVEGSGPLVRSMRSSTTCEVPVGKAFVLNELDDPISKHHFQLEVTITKLK